MGVSRLLIVGWDCADFEITEALCNRGRLPNLAALRAKGLLSPLASTIPPSSLPAWTTAFSGVGPGRHGLTEYVVKDPGAYRMRLLSSRDRATPTLFSRAKSAGLRVACLGVPGTYPPDEGLDVCIAGFDSPLSQRASQGSFVPGALNRRLRAKNLRWPYGGVDELAVGSGWHQAARESLLESIEQKTRVAEEILRSDGFDLAAVVFSEIDTASHHFWAFHDSGSPRHRRDPELGGVLEEVYLALDRALGRLLEHLHPEAAVLVLSDHGAGGASDFVFCPNRWLATQGWLHFKGLSGVPGRLAAMAVGFSARVLPASVKEAVFRGLLAGAAMRADALSRFGGLDLPRTQAYSDELPQNPGIWINLRGRDPRGIVEPGAEYEDLRDRIIERLESFRDPRSGRPVVERVLRREHAFEGPFAQRAPDLLVRLAEWDGYRLLAAPSAGRRGKVVFRLAPAERIGSKGVGVSGVHRSEGILTAAGPVLPTGKGRFGLVDVFPLAASLLGLEVASQPKDAGAGESAYTPQEEAVIRKRLEGLGYL